MITNKYNNKCASCSINVPAGSGFAYNNGGWRTVCASTACHARLGLSNAPTEKKLYDNGKVVMPYDSAAIPLLRSMPGARWNPEIKCWFVDVSPKNIKRVLELADKLSLQVSDDIRNKAKEGTKESNEAKHRAEKDGLYPFQRTGVEFLSLKDRALLADDMGCGKTIQALVALPEKAMAIVVCPAAVKYNWQDEAKKWRPDLKTTVLSGKNNFKTPDEGEVIIVNYDILPAYLTKDIPVDVKESLKRTILICDEAHVTKNYKTNRSQRVGALSRICARTWFLTGTPLLNRPFDLFGVLSSGGMEKEVFGSFNKFVELFGAYKNRFGGWEFGAPSIEVPERLRRVMLRRMKTEVLTDLPPKTYQKISVDVSGNLKNDLDLIFAENEWCFKEKTLPPFEEFSAIRSRLAESRVDAAIEIIENYEEESSPLVVFSVHKDPVKQIGSRDGWGCITGETNPIDRRDIVAAFQAGKLKGIALTIGAGGVGLTLTRADTALFLDLDWTPALNLQAEDRIARIGQLSNKVHIIHMVSRHVLDEHVHDLIRMKMRMIHEAIEKENGYIAAPFVSSGQKSGLVQETEEELQDRIRKINEAQDKIEKDNAKNRVREYLTKLNGEEFHLTDEKKKRISEAMSLMVGNCDHAWKRDDVGFNKPDARIAHWVFAAGLEDDHSYRLAEKILYKYKNTQLPAYADIWD